STSPPAGGASPPPGGPVASVPGAAAPTKPAVNHPLWAQADQAEKDGKIDDAEKLLFELARKMNEPGGDHDLANLCYTRIHALREKKRTGLAGAPGLTVGARQETGGSRPDPTGARQDRPALMAPQRNDPPAGGPP